MHDHERSEKRNRDRQRNHEGCPEFPHEPPQDADGKADANEQVRAQHRDRLFDINRFVVVLLYLEPGAGKCSLAKFLDGDLQFFHNLKYVDAFFHLGVECNGLDAVLHHHALGVAHRNFYCRDVT